MRVYYSYNPNKVTLIKIDYDNREASIIRFESEKEDYYEKILYEVALEIIKNDNYIEKRL